MSTFFAAQWDLIKKLWTWFYIKNIRSRHEVTVKSVPSADSTTGYQSLRRKHYSVFVFLWILRAIIQFNESITDLALQVFLCNQIRLRACAGRDPSKPDTFPGSFAKTNKHDPVHFFVRTSSIMRKGRRKIRAGGSVSQMRLSHPEHSPGHCSGDKMRKGMKQNLVKR